MNKNFKTNSPAVVVKFTNVEQLREILPDLLCGYLCEEEMPNSLELLTPPPEASSEAFALDLKYAKKLLALKI